MGNSQAVLRGDTSRQSHLASGQVCVLVFLTATLVKVLVLVRCCDHTLGDP